MTNSWKCAVQTSVAWTSAEDVTREKVLHSNGYIFANTRQLASTVQNVQSLSAIPLAGTWHVYINLKH